MFLIVKHILQLLILKHKIKTLDEDAKHYKNIKIEIKFINNLLMLLIINIKVQYSIFKEKTNDLNEKQYKTSVKLALIKNHDIFSIINARQKIIIIKNKFEIYIQEMKKVNEI